MSEKVKVSKEVAKAIEYLMKSEAYNGNKGRILSAHSEFNFKWRYDTPANGLNGVSVIELAEMLVNGYEINLTPEEKILSDYKTALYNIQHNQNKDYWTGYKNAIINTLNFKDVEIKGVNE